MFIKPILKTIPPEWTINEDFDDWICALAEQICKVKTSDRSQINPLKNSPQYCIPRTTTIFSQTLPLKEGIWNLKRKISVFNKKVYSPFISDWLSLREQLLIFVTVNSQGNYKYIKQQLMECILSVSEYF